MHKPHSLQQTSEQQFDACCVNKHRYATCASCDQVPCQIWKATRDPSMTDEQFEENINSRVAMLKSVGLV